MAKPKTINGTKLLIKIGDGQSPETFAHPCLINTERGIQFQSDVNEFVVPDCIDPDAPAWKEITKDGLSATITGSGMIDAGSIGTFMGYYQGTASQNIQVEIDHEDGGYWEGAFKLTGFEITGSRNEKATVSVTFQSDGVVTWEDA